MKMSERIIDTEVATLERLAADVLASQNKDEQTKALDRLSKEISELWGLPGINEQLSHQINTDCKSNRQPALIKSCQASTSPQGIYAQFSDGKHKVEFSTDHHGLEVTSDRIFEH